MIGILPTMEALGRDGTQLADKLISEAGIDVDEMLKTTDIVAVDVVPASAIVAVAANFTSTESFDGKFRLRAARIPTAAITAQYHVTNTAEYGTEE